ncbi:MAG: DUF393 domain-containing protein [Chloroflexi bacterium]|nr:DUF393 domain-containing protein [Chloroflexota bacterium]
MLTALYDGNCVICQSSCASLRALDWRRRIEFVDLHDNERWRRRYPDLHFEELMGQIHVLDQDGRLYSGFRAGRRMLKEVPLGLPLWLLLQLPGMDWIGRRVYRFVARRRYRVNKLFGRTLPDCVDDSCAMPG